MTLDKKSLPLLAEALDMLEDSFAAMPAFEPSVDLQALRPVLLEVARRMADNFPYPHPLYAGQMLKPPHPVARLAYALSLWMNPNNHALDGGRASSAMEREAVAEIATMFGWPEAQHLGHLCSGGTLANLEALWVSGQLQKDKLVVASTQAHYTHERVCGVLGLPFAKVDVDAAGCLDVDALERLARTGKLGTVVATMGSTSLGAVDPLPEILVLARTHGFRVHADAAYGGYFRLATALSSRVLAAYAALDEVDSIAIDPHKHGLQPYGCGCVLFRDPSVGRFYKHDSPYTYFSSSEMHLGEITLECSRPGASAVALWATQRLLPLRPGGAFSRDLDASLTAARALHARLRDDARFVPLHEPELDIVVWAPRAPSAKSASHLSRRIYEEAASRHLHLALTEVPRELGERALPHMHWDTPSVTALRACLMKPEHESWLDAIHALLDEAAKAAGLDPAALFTARAAYASRSYAGKSATRSELTSERSRWSLRAGSQHPPRTQNRPAH